MSTYLVSGIITLVVVLACYTFISYSMEKRRVRRQRLLAVLRQRERNFKEMLTGLPPQFLPAELNILVHRALIETCEQLATLDSKDPNHQATATFYAAQLGNIRADGEKQRVRLETPAQIKELRRYLEELYHFVQQQEARKLITPLQAATYNDQIRRLALQATVDSYIGQARLAQQRGKWRLSIHFLTLAHKQLKSENATHTYDKQISQIQGAIAKLEENLTDDPSAPAAADDQADSTASKAWENFGDEPWKKKQLYD